MLDTSTLSNSTGNKEESEKEKNIISYKILIVGEPNIGKTCLKHRFIYEEFLEDKISSIGLDYKEKVVQVTPENKIKLAIWDTAGSEKFHSIAQSFFTNCDGIILCFDLTSVITFQNLDSWIDYINTYVDLKDNFNNDNNNNNNTEENKNNINMNINNNKKKNIINEKEKFLDGSENVDKEEVEEEDDEENDENDSNEKNNNMDNNSIDDEQLRPIIVLAGTKGDLEDQKKVPIEDIKEFGRNMKCEFFETSAKDGRGINDLFLYISKEMFKKKKILKEDNNDPESKKRFKLTDKEIYQAHAGRSMTKCC